MNINKDESCNTPRFEVIGQCEGCGKTLFEDDDFAYTLDEIYLCKKCSQGIEQYSEPYKAEDVIPIVAKMNNRVLTTKRTGADRSESRCACDTGPCSDASSRSNLSANIDNGREQTDGGSPSLTPSQNVESPVNDQQAKQRSCADNGNLQQEAAWANVCGTDIPNCLMVVEGPGLTNGPLKSQIVRCPVCGSSNVHLGHATVWGTPVCCKECGHFEPSKRNEE